MVREVVPIESRVNPAGDDHKAPMHATPDLLEELHALRKRVRELEDDCSHDVTRSTPSEDRSDVDDLVESNNNLRKELAKVQNERAKMEMDMMNQLSNVVMEHQSTIEDLQERLSKSEELNITLNQAAQSSTGGVRSADLTKMLEDERARHGEETRRLHEALNNAKEENERNRSDMNFMSQQIDELESLKSTLLQEVTNARVDLGNETKVLESLQQEMEHAEREYRTEVKRLCDDMAAKDAETEKHLDELAEMNDTVIALEGQKAVLIDELTGVRFQLEREQKTNSNLKSRLEEAAQSRSCAPGDENVLEEKLRKAEEESDDLRATVEKLQLEVLSTSNSHKTEVARLEKNVRMLTTDLEENAKILEQLEERVAAEREEAENARDELAEVKQKLEKESRTVMEQQEEMETLKKNHVKEAEFLKAKNITLENEIKSTSQKLKTEQETSIMLRNEIEALKTAAGKKLNSVNSVAASPSRVNRRPETPPGTPPLSGKKVVPRPPTDDSPVRGIVQCFERRISLNSGSKSPALMPNLSDAGSLSELQVDKEDPDFAEWKNKETEIVVELQTEIQSMANKLREVEKTRKDYEKKIRELEEKVDRASPEDDDDDSVQLLTVAALKQQTTEDKEVIERLQSQVEALRDELGYAYNEVDKLKEELKQLKGENVGTGGKVRRRASLTGSLTGGLTGGLRKSSCDAEVTNLKLQLTKTRVAKEELEQEFSGRVRELEAGKYILQDELEEELERKEVELVQLRLALSEKTTQVDRLQSEREQICMSMNTMSSSRKDEIEELQTELIELSNHSASQVREIQNLKMQIEEHEFRSHAMDNLREKVEDLEEQLRSGKGTRATMNKLELDSLRDENAELRESVRSLSLERRTLQEKLNSVVADKSSSRTLQVLRDRNAALKKEVEKLTKRIKKMEGSITRVAI